MQPRSQKPTAERIDLYDYRSRLGHWARQQFQSWAGGQSRCLCSLQESLLKKKRDACDFSWFQVPQSTAEGALRLHRDCIGTAESPDGTVSAQQQQQTQPRPTGRAAGRTVAPWPDSLEKLCWRWRIKIPESGRARPWWEHVYLQLLGSCCISWLLWC